MKISDLSVAELGSRLMQDGLSFVIGPFSVRLQSAVESVAGGVAALYAPYSLDEDNPFTDFHVEIARPRGLRRWFRPQVTFSFDGFSPFKPLPAEQAFPLFEWGLNWCVATNAHQYLLLHAAVVERDGDVLLMPGPPGSGKSTLCAALVATGWRLLSDELAMVSPADGTVQPIPRPVSLKNESIEVIAKFAPHMTMGRSYVDTHKGTVAHMAAPPSSVGRASEPARLRWVVLPRYKQDAAVQLTARSKAQSMVDLATNAFNYQVLGLPGFELLADIVDRATCHEFVYGSLTQALQTIDALTGRVSQVVASDETAA